MPVSNYKIWAVGSKVGIGATAPLHVGVAGVAKAAGVPGVPGIPATTVANELICNRLGSILLLPIPPGFLIEHSGQPHYVSLNFNLGGHQLPPADPVALVAAQPELAWGIVLFDMLILNPDRHAQNINYDTASNSVQIFDHSHALLAGGRQRLVDNENLPGIAGHCLKDRLTTLQGLDKWSSRMAELPEYFLRSVVNDMADPRYAVTAPDATFCADWLVARRTRLKELVLANRGVFPGIAADVWNANNPAVVPVAGAANPAAAPPAVEGDQP